MVDYAAVLRKMLKNDKDDSDNDGGRYSPGEVPVASSHPIIGGNSELYWLSPNYTDPSKLTFPQQMHRILREHEHSAIVAWLPDGKAFVVLDQKRFTMDVLPDYFGKNIAYTSWTRRLRRWGWQNVAKSTYYNKHFHRDRPMQCLRMNYDRTPNRDGPEPRPLEPTTPVSARTQQHNRSSASAMMGVSPGGGGGGGGHQRRGGGGLGGGGSSHPMHHRHAGASQLFSQSSASFSGGRSGSMGSPMNQQNLSDAPPFGMMNNSGGFDEGLSSFNDPDTLQLYMNQMGMMDRQMEDVNRAQMTRNMTLQQLKQQQELLAHQQRLMSMAMAHTNQLAGNSGHGTGRSTRTGSASGGGGGPQHSLFGGGGGNMPQSPFHSGGANNNNNTANAMMDNDELTLNNMASAGRLIDPSTFQQQLNLPATLSMNQNAQFQSAQHQLNQQQLQHQQQLAQMQQFMDPFLDQKPVDTNFEWDEGKDDGPSPISNSNLRQEGSPGGNGGGGGNSRVPMPQSFMPRHNRRPGAA